MSASQEVVLLSKAHAAGLHTLLQEPDVAAVAAIAAAPSMTETLAYIAAAEETQEDGHAFLFVLTDGNEVSGICRLIGVRGVPRLIVAVGHAYRGQGNGLRLVRHVLEYAFETLHEERVTAGGACLLLMSRFGRIDGNGLTKQEWRAARARLTSPTE